MTSSPSPEPLDRLTFLKQAFGAQAESFEKTLNQLQENAYNAYAHKLSLNLPVMKTRQQLAKSIPHFWSTSLRNCRATQQLIDPVDEDLMTKYLDDVWIQHDEKEVREWEVTFTFSPNPYFTNPTLTRSFTLTPPAGSPPAAAAAAAPFDLDAPLYLLPLEPTSRIQWTSPSQDLTKKAPRQDPRDLEEFDEFAGSAGSFFNSWKEEADGEDVVGFGELLLEWWSNATEYAAGLTALLDGDSDDDEGGLMMDSDDEEEDDVEDPTRAIDLGSDEEEEEEQQRPRKKRKGGK